MRAEDVAARLVTGVHRAEYSASDGRLGGRTAGMPVVQLATVGPKTGKRRVTMLTSPVHDRDRIVLVAFYGGDDRHPAWFLNLRDHPDVELTMHGETRPMRARVASPDEKARLWPQIADHADGDAGYPHGTRHPGGHPEPRP